MKNMMFMFLIFVLSSVSFGSENATCTFRFRTDLQKKKDYIVIKKEKEVKALYEVVENQSLETAKAALEYIVKLQNTGECQIKALNCYVAASEDYDGLGKHSAIRTLGGWSSRTFAMFRNDDPATSKALTFLIELKKANLCTSY